MYGFTIKEYHGSLGPSHILGIYEGDSYMIDNNIFKIYKDGKKKYDSSICVAIFNLKKCFVEISDGKK